VAGWAVLAVVFLGSAAVQVPLASWALGHRPEPALEA
jgi:hypothetical protein